MAGEKSNGRTRRVLIILAAIALAAGIIEAIIGYERGKGPHRHELECTICLEGWKSPKINYCAGFEYELLKRYAKDSRRNADISLAKDPRSVIDSLQCDDSTLVIAVLPASDTLVLADSLLTTEALIDGMVWVMPKDSEREFKHVTDWLGKFQTSEEYENMVSRFSPSYNPFARINRGRKYANVSPYDSLFIKYAKEIGWDWRMLAALSWKESKFRIEAVSRRGAVGLMQMMPRTADKYDINNMLDPEENIKAAANHLGRLKSIVKRYAHGQDNLMKMTLATYNAGEGRLADCLKFAEENGLPHSTWDELAVEVIPKMRRDSAEAGAAPDSSLSLGFFKGTETIRYVEDMEALYRTICAIAPAQSSQGQPAKRKDTAGAKGALSPARKQGQPRK